MAEDHMRAPRTRHRVPPDTIELTPARATRRGYARPGRRVKEAQQKTERVSALFHPQEPPTVTTPPGLVLDYEITSEVIESGVTSNSLRGRPRFGHSTWSAACAQLPGTQHGHVPHGQSGARRRRLRLRRHGRRWVGGQAEYVTIRYADFQLLKFPDKEQAMEKMRDLSCSRTAVDRAQSAHDRDARRRPHRHSGLYVTEDPGAKDEAAKTGNLSLRSGLGWAKSHALFTGQTPVMKYNRCLIMAILHDRIHIAKAVNVTVISLDATPQGYADFDNGAAKKFVIDPAW